jgi:hypothetical protein
MHRKDNDGDYETGNCEWLSKGEHTKHHYNAGDMLLPYHKMQKRYEFSNGLRRMPLNTRLSQAHPYGPFDSREAWLKWAGS